MKNRTLPYGYEVRNGVICESASEAVVVRRLFSRYAEGKSFKDLAICLQAEGVPYHGGDVSWNKNKVARIINSSLYLGTEKYPPLVTQELYDRAAAKKPSCDMTEETSRTRAVWQLSRCACCGGKIRVVSGKTGWNRWRCPDCDQIGPKAVTPRILTNLNELWNNLLTGAIKITTSTCENAPDASLTEAENAFDALLNEDGFDEKTAMSAAMKLAAMRYERIPSADYETERIRYILQNAAPVKEVDVAMLRSISSAIQIHPDGRVSVRLTNGQMLEGDERT